MGVPWREPLAWWGFGHRCGHRNLIINLSVNVNVGLAVLVLAG